MTTSHKHRAFVLEPMGEKSVEALPGIGKALGGRLRHNGYDKAYMVQGQYLLLRKNETDFRQWLSVTSGANTKQSGDCYNSLHDWRNQFM
ncbi:barrier-to-autointegration factor-like [Latimeria chalumnae]|uniref:barrier-to-autointegration factor-like n=1 Tax=Latimeria chalumnae TaxID=7897 RepID=UPI00313E19EC